MRAPWTTPRLEGTQNVRFLPRLLLSFCLWALFPFYAQAQRLSPLAPIPDWSELEAFQEAITKEDFVQSLETIYAPGNAAADFLAIEADQVVIKKTLQPLSTFTLRFAPDHATAKPIPRYWQPLTNLPPASVDRPLAGWKIALDPGHLGGAWARMEERWFQMGDGIPVMEGDMTLLVAKHLSPLLQALGAEVALVREQAGPTTSQRPEDLREIARAQLALRENSQPPKETYNGPEDPNRANTVQQESELLFYRISEIRQRAKWVNEVFHPDLTICIHFNAEAWGDPHQPSFVENNHLHLLINGCYSAAELRHDDLRRDMLLKLLSQAWTEELTVSEQVAASLARATALPPYEYPGTNARRLTAYVWARNLLANRLFRSPVIFLEPYVMNHQEVWTRVQAGDYEGEREVAGQQRKSIYREYADAVAEGVRASALLKRPPAHP